MYAPLPPCQATDASALVHLHVGVWRLRMLSVYSHHVMLCLSETSCYPHPSSDSSSIHETSSMNFQVVMQARRCRPADECATERVAVASIHQHHNEQARARAMCSCLGSNAFLNTVC